MHIAASRPLCISSDQISADLIAKEKNIYAAQAAASSKPPYIIEKIVEGRLRDYFEEITLLSQPFIKAEDKQSVEKLLKAHQAKVIRFERFELGEGIEKKRIISLLR